eukprot:5966327-Prymnesium_polylepis.1
MHHIGTRRLSHHIPRFHFVLSRLSSHNLNCAICASHARLRVTTEGPQHFCGASKQCLTHPSVVTGGYGTRHANMAHVRGRANDTERGPTRDHRFSACLMPAREDARLQAAHAHTRPPPGCPRARPHASYVGARFGTCFACPP